MPVFHSSLPDIKLPTGITIWDWLFDSPGSPIARYAHQGLAGFNDAITKERVDWQQVKQASTYISTALVKKYGFKQGDTLSMFSRNTIWYPVTMFSVIRVGGIVSGASPAYSVEEMTYALKIGGARFLATSPTSIEVASKAAANAGIPRERIFLLEGELPGYTTVKQLIDIGKSFGVSGQSPALKIPPGKTNRDFCAFLSYSSGTTGLPKAVMIAHQNVIAEVLQVAPCFDFKRSIACLPLFHITGLIHSMHVCILNNAENYFLPQFTMESMLETISKYRITEPLIVPPIVIRLLRDPLVTSGKYDLTCIKAFCSGAAPLSREALALLARRFPGTGFRQGYGMTESTSCVTLHPNDKLDHKYAHTVGMVCASTSLKIVAEDGRECGVDEAGEIWARGPQVTLGYLDNEGATRETFDGEGWLRTGDVGRIDGEGFVTVVDRIKELIKVKGLQVAPAEMEDLLLGCEVVEDCTVVGVPDAWSGEVPKAYVVLKEKFRGGDVTSLGRELMRYVQERKVKHKWIREVEIVDAVPKSASGKILRRVLRDAVRKGERKGILVTADDGETGRARL